MRRLLKGFGGVISAFLWVHLIWSYANWNINPEEWDFVSRLTAALAGGMIGMIVFILIVIVAPQE